MSEEGSNDRFSGSDTEFALIGMTIAFILGIFAAIDGAYDLAIASVPIGFLCAFFAWRSWRREDRGRR